ncbi:MAG: hypothetical protein II139_07150, partial [Lachnospiraceae bacterium]|nr:hypothetical protein [Lachnospiraceae bacterium]
MQNRLAGILAAFFLCLHFNLYKIFKVHHSALTFYLQACIFDLCKCPVLKKLFHIPDGPVAKFIGIFRTFLQAQHAMGMML